MAAKKISANSAHQCRVHHHLPLEGRRLRQGPLTVLPSPSAKTESADVDVLDRADLSRRLRRMKRRLLLAHVNNSSLSSLPSTGTSEAPTTKIAPTWNRVSSGDSLSDLSEAEDEFPAQ